MSHYVQHLYAIRSDWDIYSVVVEGSIQVRARKRLRDMLPNEDDRHFIITEVGWAHHLNKPAVPLDHAILEMIGNRMADLVRDSLATGYLHAQQDIRKALGL